MRYLVLGIPLLAACQDYNLAGPEDQAGKYNPPDLVTPKQVDRVTQITIPSVDVLWVIDNSCSMQAEQASLRSNFGDFMQYFTDSGLDYHVGVVSTDMEDRDHRGKLQLDNRARDRFIDDSYSSSDALNSFRERANLGIEGSGTECGKDAAFTALTTELNATNAGFYREEAGLSIIVISDEFDYSQVTDNEFIAWMQALKVDPETVTFSSIVGLSDHDCGSTQRGTGYLEVTEAVGGIEWSICTEDWAGLLTQLGLQAAGLKREFFLSLVPIEDTIAVTAEVGEDDRAFGDDEWTYSRTRNSITFTEYIPDPLTVVNIEYDVLATSHDPAAEEEEEEGDSGA